MTNISFDQLSRQLRNTINANEREILVRGISRIGNFDQISRQLRNTINASEREILVRGISEIGNFDQISRQLRNTINASEREILVTGMTRVSDKPSDTVKLVTTIRKQYDLFIAHASEDKTFVAPLAQALAERKMRVWYDDFILKAGDSLRREIDKGLSQSRYGVVVLSHNFFNKHYPQKELDGLAAKERLNIKVIIPIWHNIDREDIERYSPTLADIIAIKSNQPIHVIVDRIIEAIS